jgi:predicted Rossmann fold flavoprotein
MIYDVVVVGGGASGMMAAIAAARTGVRVVILEKNQELGAKLQISGGGRCNILNAEYDLPTLLSHYATAAKSLYPTFSIFGVSETVECFRSIGIEVVVEERKRAFPSTHRATDVCAALVRELERLGVKVRMGVEVQELRVMGEEVGVNTKADSKIVVGVKVRGEENLVQGKRYILATGGLSHPETGSTGDGFEFLRVLGHTVHTPTPGLVPLRSSTTWVHALSGQSIEGAKMTWRVDGQVVKVVKNTLGEFQNRILCTHTGLSGPTILHQSAAVREWLEEGEVVLELDLYPNTDHGALDRQILTIFNQSPNKQLGNVLSELYPGRLLEMLIISTDLTRLDTPVHSVPKDARKRIVGMMKALPIVITGLMGYDKAVVANGGLPLAEVDLRTMQSKMVHNLAITGDLLDIERPSGGYSLQLCWTTGYVAGVSANNG